MGGSIYKDEKSGKWCVCVYWQNKRYRIWRYYFNYSWYSMWDERTAKKMLSAIQREIDNHEFNPKAWFPESPLSMKQYAQEWLCGLTVCKNTLKAYRCSVNNDIIPFFGEKDMRHIRYNDIAAFYNSMNRSQKGKYNSINVLKKMLRDAWRNEDLVRVPPFPKIGQGEPPIIEYLTREQQEKILANIPDEHRPIFIFMMEYGVRPGEARALQKDCVTEEEITIKRSYSADELRETTKTGKVRIYGITSTMRKVFRAMPLTFSPHVFTKKNERQYTQHDLNNIWHRGCEQAGINIRLYNATRHSLASQLLDGGVDLEDIRDALGHTKTDITRRYTRRSNERITAILENRRKVIPLSSKYPVNEKVLENKK